MLRSFDAFLNALLDRESGLRPSLFDWYKANLDVEAIAFPAVSSPGNALRDPVSGAFVIRMMTVRDYFDALGVLGYFDARDPACIPLMQYAVTNPLGFIGYQIGEAILIKNGYYLPKRVLISGADGFKEAEAFYVNPNDVAPRSCGAGRGDACEHVCPTEVNRWEGRFLGKNGLGSLDDLKTADIQERVIRDLMAATATELDRALSTCGLRYPRSFPRSRKAVLHAAHPPVEVRLTASGLLAAAHLCGVEAVRRFFERGLIPRDEYGTGMLDYIVELGDYEINP
jgi:hypothetical protein